MTYERTGKEWKRKIKLLELKAMLDIESSRRKELLTIPPEL